MSLSVVSVINVQSALQNEIEIFILINFTGKISECKKSHFIRNGNEKNALRY